MGDGLGLGSEAGAGGPGAHVDVDQAALRDVEAIPAGGVGEALEVLAELLALEGLHEADEGT